MIWGLFSLNFCEWVNHLVSSVGRTRLMAYILRYQDQFTCAISIHSSVRDMNPGKTHQFNVLGCLWWYDAKLMNSLLWVLQPIIIYQQFSHLNESPSSTNNRVKWVTLRTWIIMESDFKNYKLVIGKWALPINLSSHFWNHLCKLIAFTYSEQIFLKGSEHFQKLY